VSHLPTDMMANQAASWIFLAAMATFFCGCLLWATAEHRRVIKWVPLLAFLGGLIASLEEAWIDAQIQLWYPSDAPLIALTVLGHHQPVYLHLAYAGFVGLGAYVVYRGLVRYGDGRILWPIFFSICALDLAFELPATLAGVYHYYGPQPFQFAHDSWPLWVAPINAAGPILGGYLMYRLVPLLTGWTRLLVALLPPLTYAGVYGATVWPTASALKSDVPTPWMWGIATISMALSALIVALIQIAVKAQPTPADADGAAPRRRDTLAGSPL
jgi:hypothetical protein